MKKIVLAATAAVVMAGGASAATFTNGNFESGDLSGWTQGGGYWSDYAAGYPQAADYAPGGADYVPSLIANSVTNIGFAPHTDGKLRSVYAGQHSAQVNDTNNNYSVSSISQVVKNYSDSHIAFAYAAVLQQSHDLDDSDAFSITLTDLTTKSTLYTYNLNSAAAPGVFTESTDGWFYTDWLTKDIAVTAGHDFELTLLANDCPYGGHAGYALLDGFGGVVPPPITGGGAVPEPASWAMMIGGIGFVGGAMRRRTKHTVSFA
jgi:hypothetical protein